MAISGMALKLTPENTLFENWCEHILGIEKKFSDVPGDRGGKTYWGWTLRTLQDIGEPPPQNRNDAKALYLNHIWNPNRLDEFQALVSWTYGDSLVNHNPVTAAKLVQYGLRVSDDGIFGPLSRAAASPNEVNTLDYWKRYRERRVKYYHDIIERRSSQSKFIEGWMNRMFILAENAYEAGLIVPKLSRSL